MIGLKPCPFCGGKASIKRFGPSLPELPNPFWIVECKKNNRCTSWPSAGGDTKAEAALNWNKREEAA